ncbi:hypothetical protein, partial [Niastella yeongjuensis]|uniref:hypothetical protein n=1 Tax=Niastella yeongjuensis TaxID=354355 RepID=UPI001C43090C
MFLTTINQSLAKIHQAFSSFRFIRRQNRKLFSTTTVNETSDQIEKLGELGESRCFAANKTDEKHWKRIRKKN